MMTDVKHLLPLYALGILDATEARTVEHAVASDPALAAELASFQDTTHDLTLPVAPSPEVKARLMASIGGGPFEKLSARMASLFDVTVDKARELLGLIERPASWFTEVPGIDLVHFDGGPAFAGADCGFIRLAAGATFPPHTHLGEEVSLVIIGTLQDDAGRLYQPGDELVQTEGSAHHITAVGGTICIFAARATNGISVAGAPVRPSKRSLD
ncbi:MAG: cupin domain-containing protein [Kofleriaceae bacterium]